MFRRYKTLRQSVKICAGSFRYVVVRRHRVWWIAIISARSIFWSPGSLSAILRFLKGYICHILLFLVSNVLGLLLWVV